MTKEFRINSAFRYCSAVHCNILPMFSGTVTMNYLWKYFLTGPTLARNQYRKVCGGHLNSNIYSSVKPFKVANYSKPLFNILQIFHVRFYNGANLTFF